MTINALLAHFDLKPQHIYLLDLVPLIEVVWADGENQESEMAIVKEITQKHVAELSQLADGVEILSAQDVTDFLEKFLHNPPPAGMLKELREIAIQWWNETGQTHKKAEAIIDYCLDIAAACVATYPYRFNERIMEQEKALIKEIAVALGL